MFESLTRVSDLRHWPNKQRPLDVVTCTDESSLLARETGCDVIINVIL